MVALRIWSNFITARILNTITLISTKGATIERRIWSLSSKMPTLEALAVKKNPTIIQIAATTGLTRKANVV
jgi:hypothetical protein